MEQIRAFIALNLPIAAVNRIASLQADLKHAARREGTVVRWVPAPNMHVTLKFLGEMALENAYGIRDLLRERLSDRAALPLRMRRIGTFPGDLSPRVLWLGLDDAGAAAGAESSELVRLAADVETWLGELGFPAETRPYHAHLTLGRLREGLGAFWRDSADVDLGETVGQSVVLYRSELRREGAEYTAIERISLQA